MDLGTVPWVKQNRTSTITMSVYLNSFPLPSRPKFVPRDSRGSTNHTYCSLEHTASRSLTCVMVLNHRSKLGSGV